MLSEISIARQAHRSGAVASLDWPHSETLGVKSGLSRQRSSGHAVQFKSKCLHTMDAQLVWNMWRKILSGEKLSGLTPDEAAVVQEYMSTPTATDTYIGLYRQSLKETALSSLRLAQFCQRLFRTSGIDNNAVASDFVQRIGYQDYGPNSWHLAAAFLDDLAARPEFSSPLFQDAFALDRGLTTLAQRLGESPPKLWPDQRVDGEIIHPGSDNRSDVRFKASPAAIVVKTLHDITSWVEDPQGFDVNKHLVIEPRHWLIYYPNPESTHVYAALSERSAHILLLLETPMTADDVARSMETLSMPEALQVIESLAAIGVVYPIAANNDCLHLT